MMEQTQTITEFRRDSSGISPNTGRVTDDSIGSSADEPHVTRAVSGGAIIGLMLLTAGTVSHPEYFNSQLQPEKIREESELGWVRRGASTNAELQTHIHSPAKFDELSQLSSDRIKLLARKYASESLQLSKEDQARLEILKARFAMMVPRVSTEDIAELSGIAEQLDQIMGQNSDVRNSLGRG